MLFRSALIEPTRIYVQSLLPTIRAGTIDALAHITGGGLLENVPRVLPETLAAAIDQGAIRLPPVFEWLQVEARLDAPEMLRTFNCGIGMVAVVSPSDVDRVLKALGPLGKEAVLIGSLIPRGRGDRVRLDGKPWSAS